MSQTKDLVAFHLRVDSAMKNIMKDGKIDLSDMPELVLLIADLQMTQFTEEDLRISVCALYDYIMSHYKLYPEDETKKANFKKLFESCLRLMMLQPKVKQATKKCLACF